MPGPRARRAATGGAGHVRRDAVLIASMVPPPVEDGLGHQVGVCGHGGVVGAVDVGVGHGLEASTDVLGVLKRHAVPARQLSVSMRAETRNEKNIDQIRDHYFCRNRFIEWTIGVSESIGRDYSRSEITSSNSLISCTSKSLSSFVSQRFISLTTSPVSET